MEKTMATATRTTRDEGRTATTTQKSGKEDSTWDNIKNAMKRDWEQTKNDFGSDDARDMDQDVDDTVKQMFGKDSRFEDHEPAFRYGHEANQRHGREHPEWNADLERKLEAEYQGDWRGDRPFVRYGYQHAFI
tara:strand:+ start:71079 stop:71477 length:399 start_codon:yes stop_codon:yes gene_type:complete